MFWQPFWILRRFRTRLTPLAQPVTELSLLLYLYTVCKALAKSLYLYNYLVEFLSCTSSREFNLDQPVAPEETY